MRIRESFYKLRMKGFKRASNIETPRRALKTWAVRMWRATKTVKIVYYLHFMEIIIVLLF